jgi:hypothetical protein
MHAIADVSWLLPLVTFDRGFQKFRSLKSVILTPDEP